MLILGESGEDWHAAGRALMAVIRGATWVPRRFLAAGRNDLRSGRMSLATLGFGIPIVWLLATPLAFTIGGLVTGAWVVLGWTSISLGLAYPLLHAGDAAYASARPGAPSSVQGGSGCATVSVGAIDLSFVAGAFNSTGFSTSTVVLIGSTVALQVAAYVWGRAGRPSLLR